MYISNNGKFKEGIIWWDTEMDPSADVDIFFYIHDYDKRAEHAYGFKTLEVDLNKTEEEIWAGYKPNLRNELRKASMLAFEYRYKESPSDEDIGNYVERYNSFAEFKNLQKTSVELITQLKNDRKLVISEVLINGELINTHSHYVAGCRTRLYQSFSVINSQSSSTSALANKALTNSDILYFKGKNIDLYDFGGIGNAEGDNDKFKGIIRFKKQFGGEEKLLWKGSTANGERGRKVYEKYFK